MDYFYIADIIRTAYKESIQTDFNGTARNKFQFVFSRLLILIKNLYERKFSRTFQSNRLFYSPFICSTAFSPFFTLNRMPMAPFS